MYQDERPSGRSFCLSKIERNETMNHNTDTAYTFLVGGGFSALSFLVGGFDNLIIALVIFMTADYITGMMVGWKTKTLSSAIGFNGLMKKTAMILAVVVAVQLDSIFGNQGQVMRYAMIMGLIGLEGVSLLENWGNLGFKVPKVISESFIQLKNENGPNTTPPKDGE